MAAGSEAQPDVRYEFYVDPSRCIGCQSCLKACEECETHRGVSMINFDFVDRPETIATAALRLLALRRSDLRPGLPGRRDQERTRTALSDRR